MYTVYPDYYPDFKCTADKCRHNCCIGWEIDIDQKTAEYYKNLPGEMGEHIRRNIDWTDTPHFKLAEHDRCPMLDSRGLCTIMLNLGTDCVCDICAEHPRFYNELDDHVECGLGLSCEAVCDLIINNKNTVKLLGYTDAVKQNTDVQLRDHIIELLQDRNKSMEDRLSDALNACGIPSFDPDLRKWTDILTGLERLSEDWTDVLYDLKTYHSPETESVFDGYMHDRTAEYEQLAVYIIYRYMIQTDITAQEACLFAAFTYCIIHAAGAAIFAKKGSFTCADQLDIIRMYSAEIEYSTDNLYIILDALNEQYL